MNKVESIRKLNETELRLGIAGTSASWHEDYALCPFLYAGGLPLAFTEGDLLAIFEQYGTIVHVNLIRDNESGKSRGFAFLQYRDRRSAVLAIDNFNGVELTAGRTLRVDHARDYTLPESGSVGLNTMPQELREVNTRAANAPVVVEDGANAENGNNTESQAMEARRAKAVFHRLRAMRRRRERELNSSSTREEEKQEEKEKPEPPKEENEPKEKSPEGIPVQREAKDVIPGVATRIDKVKRKQEKEQRKAERARIREERRKRRAERQKVP